MSTAAKIPPAVSATSHGGLRNRWAVAYLAALLAAFARPLRELFQFSLGHDFGSYIPLIPLVAAYLLWTRREIIFANSGHPAPGAAALLAISGVLAAGGAEEWFGRIAYADHLGLLALSLVLFIFAGVFAFFGQRVFRAGLFPWLFLLLIIPFPPFLLGHAIYALQDGSTRLTAAVFSLLGVPVFRQGFNLSIPGITIRVAKECSSIRSSQALAITALLAGYFYLRSPWRRALLVVIAIPFSVVKNAIRICTLCLLSLRVNPGFLYGRLHHEGGFVFFLIALLLLWPVLVWLRRTEPPQRSLPGASDS